MNLKKCLKKCKLLTQQDLPTKYWIKWFHKKLSHFKFQKLDTISRYFLIGIIFILNILEQSNLDH